MHPLLILFFFSLKNILGLNELLGVKLNGQSFFCKIWAFLLTAEEIFCETLRAKTYLLDAIVGAYFLDLSRSAFFVLFCLFLGLILFSRYEVYISVFFSFPLRLKIRQISFFMFSVSLGVVLVVASPSSLYPTLMLRSCS